MLELIKLDTCTQILQCARICFDRQGFSGTTVGDICREAGVAPATLYRHFRNKEALFAATGLADRRTDEASPHRQAILEAALELFSRQGYAGSTMAEVAAAAGVSRATLYAQFSGKEALLTALLQEQPAMALASRLPESGPADPEQDLELLARQFLQLYRDPRRVAVLRLVLVEGHRFPSLASAFAELVQAGSDAMARYLARISPTLPDPHFTARHFLGGLISFVLTQQVVPAPIPPVYTLDEIARQAARQLAAALSEEA